MKRERKKKEIISNSRGMALSPYPRSIRWPLLLLQHDNPALFTAVLTFLQRVWADLDHTPFKLDLDLGADDDDDENEVPLSAGLKWRLPNGERELVVTVLFNDKNALWCYMSVGLMTHNLDECMAYIAATIAHNGKAP